MVLAAIAWTSYVLGQKIEHATRAIPPRRYPCTFIWEIYAREDDVVPAVFLRQKPRVIMLPFPPYPGLEVSDFSEVDGEFMSGPIRKVAWNGQHFHCRVEPRKLSSPDLLGGLIGMYERYGWSTGGDPRAEAALAEWKAQQAAREAAEESDRSRDLVGK